MSETVLGGSQGSGNPDAGQGGGNPSDGGAGGQGAGAGAAGQSAGSGSGGQASWRDSLPEGIRNEPSLKTFTDVGALAQSYVHAQKKIGEKGAILPTDKSSDQDWQQFYKQLGQPELEKFEIKAPEGVEMDKELLTKFKETAHKAGLLPKQAQGVVDWFTKAQVEQQAAATKAAELKVTDQIKGLRTEWGSGYDKQVALANYVVTEVGGQEFAQYVASTGLGNDVSLIKLFAKIGAALGGEKTIRGDGAGKFGSTPAEIQSEIAKLSVHPGYANSKHPEHQRINREMEELYKSLHPSKAG